MTNPLNTKDINGIDRRSVDFMVRSMQDYHIKLSQMADQKAQILLGVCSIIMTISLNQLTHNHFSYGMFVLSIGMLITMIPTVITVIPRLGAKNHDADKKETTPRLVNPLFFADFTNVTSQQFLEEMNHIISDSDELYKALFLNVYNNGKVLAEKKYRLLAMGYNFFLIASFIGVVVTALELS
ncbi:MAG: hypothetical protein ACI9EW_002530 [Cellvibrionaceae bacterium]|jgi:hypothetical protein